MLYVGTPPVASNIRSNAEHWNEKKHECHFERSEKCERKIMVGQTSFSKKYNGLFIVRFLPKPVLSFVEGVGMTSSYVWIAI